MPGGVFLPVHVGGGGSLQPVIKQDRLRLIIFGL